MNVKSKVSQVSSRELRNILTEVFGFESAAAGMSGVEAWRDAAGRRLRVNLRRSNVDRSGLQGVARQLEQQGVCSTREFLERLRTERR